MPCFYRTSARTSIKPSSTTSGLSRLIRTRPTISTTTPSFLEDSRKDFDQAEQYYQRALQADPNNANVLGSYAVLLRDIRKDWIDPEVLPAGSPADPNNANVLGNYAGNALAQGNRNVGLTALDHTIAKLPNPLSLGLAAEAWFYAYAHWPEERRAEALRNLKRVLLEGTRSARLESYR